MPRERALLIQSSLLPCWPVAWRSRGGDGSISVDHAKWLKGVVVHAESSSKRFTRVGWVAVGDSELKGRSSEAAIPGFFHFDRDG